MNAGMEVGIAGCAIHAPQRSASRSLEESVYAVTWAALRDAGFDIEAIEGIVVAGNDQLDGRAISVMMAARGCDTAIGGFFRGVDLKDRRPSQGQRARDFWFELERGGKATREDSEVGAYE